MSAPPAAAPPAGPPPVTEAELDPDDALLARLARRCLAGGSWVLLAMGLTLAIGVARTVVVARQLGPGELGVMAIGLLVLGALEALTSSGVETALVTHPGDPEADLDAAFTLQAVRGVLLAAILWLAAPLVGGFFANAAAVPVVRAVGAVALLRGLANPRVAMLVRRIDFQRVFWWTLPELVVGFGLAVWLAGARGDVWALVIAAVAAQAVATAATYAMLPYRPRLRLPGDAVRRLLGYGRWVSGGRALMFMSVNLDDAVVGRALGTSALGLYQVAFRIGELGVVTFTRALLQVALPALTALQGRREQLRRAYVAAWRVVVGANLAFAVVVAVAAGPLVDLLLGDAWRPVVPVLRILVVAMVFRAQLVLASELFNAVQQPALTIRVNSVRLVAMLASILPLLHLAGLPGVALSVLIGSLAGSLLALRYTAAILRPAPAVGLAAAG